MATEAAILLVDDKPGSAESMLKLLAAARCGPVIHVWSAPEALRRVEHRLPRLIVCERFLQPINVIDLKARLRVRQSWAAVPIVVVCHKDDPEDAARLSAVGLPHRLVRPVTADALSAMLSRLGLTGLAA